MQEAPTKRGNKNRNQRSSSQEQNSQIFRGLSKINYSSLSTMQSVLTDSSSFMTYMSMIKNNNTLFHDKVILHLASDCNCLYSIFAAQAGAKTVHCILYGHSQNEEKNKYMMEEIIKENGQDHIIKVCLFKNIKIEGKVDVIIAEPMGTNLFYDGMVDKIIQSRDMFLNKATGIIIPNKIRYKCALVWDEYQKDEKIQYWNQVYGVNMKQMKKWVAQQPSIKVVDPTLIISQITRLFQFDLYRTSYEQIDDINKNISLNALNPQNQVANGLAIWFEAQFIEADGGTLLIDASPWCQETRWSHMTLYTSDEWKLEKGVTKKIQFSAKKNYLYGNAIIKLKIDNREQTYTVW